MKNVFFGAIFTAIAFTNAAAVEKGFLVIGNPAAAKLFDQYEQSLSGVNKNRLPPGVPFEIQTKKQLMGDQITPGMRLSYLKETYYLMLDESGNTSGLPADASATFYKGCSPQYDTVAVSNASITMTQEHSSGGKRTVIKKDGHVVRIFTCRQGTYLFYPAATVFGWTSAGNSAFVKLAKAPAAEAVSFDDLHRRIMKRLDQANERYDSVFAYFNDRTNQQRSVPRWSSTPGGKHYSYTLDAPSEVVRQFDRSTGYIVNDIERMLLGKPFTVNYHNGKITILPR